MSFHERFQTFRRTIAFRYLSVVSGFLLAAFFLLGAVEQYVAYQRAVAALDTEVQQTADFISVVCPELVLFNDFLRLETLMRATNIDPNVIYSVILKPDGLPLTRYVAAEKPAIAEAMTAVENGGILDIIAHVRKDNRVREVRRQIVSEGIVLGEVLMGYVPLTASEQVVQGGITTAVIVISAALFLSLITVGVFNRQISVRLQRVTGYARGMAAGDLSLRANIERDDEIGQLNSAFNVMAERLEKTLTGLREANQATEEAYLALRTSEAEARKLSEVASRTDNMVVIADPDGRIEWVNDAFVRITGYSLEEAIGGSPGGLLQGPESDPEVIAYMKERLSANQGFNCEIINYTKSGRQIWVSIEVQPVYDELGNLVNYIGVESDITERKEYERSITESENRTRRFNRIIAQTAKDIDEQMRDTLEMATNALGMHVGTISRHQNGAFEIEKFYATEAAAELRDQADLLRHYLAQQVSEDEVKVIDGLSEPQHSSHQLYLKAGLQRVITTRIKAHGRSYGNLCFASFHSPAFRAEDKDFVQRLAFWVGSAVERRNAEAARREANAQLERAARLKDEFLANMSHELRTPLTAILGQSELLLEGIQGPLSERQQARIKIIEESGQHLLALITDVLDVAKIEAGKFVLEFSQVDVKLVCESGQRMLKQLAFAKNLAVSCNISPDVPAAITADARRLKQIFVNLISNAVKFTPEGGSVGSEITADRTNKLIHFTIWDTGPGISPEDSRRLFQPFVQIESSLSRSYDGTGLGLALVARLTELHGGTVSLESELGSGSRFTVSLPWDQESVDADLQPQTAP